MKATKKAKAVCSAFAFLFLFAALLPLAPARPADSFVELPEGQKAIALTFDDGPMRPTTLTLLDGLAQRGVPVTFFLIGEQIPGNEDILRRMAEEGHQIGIHSYSHIKLTQLNAADFSAEVDRTRKVLSNVLGDEKFFLRPPYGLTDAGVLKRAKAPILLWSVDPEDWKDKDPERIAAHIITNAKDGSIVLLHDIYPESVEAALRVVDALHEKGFYFLTVSDLLALRGITPEEGVIYRHAYP